MEAHFWDWLHHGGAMLPQPSHPLVHPDPAPEAAAAAAAEQGQAPAVGAQGQGQGPAPAAAAAQGQAVVAAQGQGQGPAPAPAGVAQGQPAAAAAQGQNGDAPPPGVLMVDLLGAPGTSWGLGTRLAQAVFAAAAVAFMASTDDFHVVTAFRLLVAAASLQCLWSLALGAVDIYALLVKRSFRSPRATTMYSIGDWVTGALTFAAASGSAGITILLDDDLMMCSDNHCPSFMAATAMAFFSWFAIAPSCLFNLMMAVYRVQRA